LNIGSQVHIEVYGFIIALLLLDRAFENLIFKHLSFVGLDRIGFLIALLFNKKIPYKALKNPKTFIRLGIYQISMLLGAVWYYLGVYLEARK